MSAPLETPKFRLSRGQALTPDEVSLMQAMEAECAKCSDACGTDSAAADIETLQYPPNFDTKIERGEPLFGTSKAHRWHVIMCLGVSAARWPAHLDENSDSYAAKATVALDKVLTKTGNDKAFLHAITRASENGVDPEIECDIIIFPEAVIYHAVPRDDIEALLTQHMVTNNADPAAAAAAAPSFPAPVPLPRGTSWVFICGHKLRDNRCWVAAQVLSKQFAMVREALGLDESIEIDLISHVGGHKYAGNVVIHRPTDAATLVAAADDAAAAKGALPEVTSTIWYGRVGPEHVRAIVEKTLLKGEVLLPLLRGRTGQW